MVRMKPRLIVVPDDSRKKRSFRSFFFFLVVFCVGVFLGGEIVTRYSGVKLGKHRGTGKERKEFVGSTETEVATKINVHATNNRAETPGEKDISSKPLVDNPGSSFEGESAQLGSVQEGVFAESGFLYTVQVGAFRDHEIERAFKLIDRLKERGYDAYITFSNSVEGSRWNTVRVGRFKTIKEATALAQILRKEEGLEEAFVLRFSGY